MGWWGHDLLSGDPPLDTLGYLSEIVGEDLYPLDFDDDKAARVRSKLEATPDEMLLTGLIAGEGGISVVAAVFLHTGAAMSERFLIEALTAAGDDYWAESNGWGWRDGGIGRAKTMEDFMVKLKQHEPGKRTAIEHEGLFAKLERHYPS